MSLHLVVSETLAISIDWASLLACSRRQTFSPRKENVPMTKTLDVITEIIRNPKHPFRKADDRPVKAQKHRYERRKVKEFIRLGDWAQEQQVFV
jgi:hypothetical protein